MSSRPNFFLEHDLFRKPVPTFRDHALGFAGPRPSAMCSPRIGGVNRFAAATLFSRFAPRRETVMFPQPSAALKPNTYAFESSPLVKPTGFREYDARWLLDREINLMGVQALGIGLGTLIHQLGVRPEIVTGHDFRAYSAAVKSALISGLMGEGCKVHDIGLALT